MKSPNTKFGASGEIYCKFCTTSGIVLVAMAGFALGGGHTQLLKIAVLICRVNRMDAAALIGVQRPVSKD